jgi:hypothetical protein
MEEILRTLIEDLEAIEEEHEEVGDTAVQEAMRAAVQKGFINAEAGFLLGDEFEMYTTKGNKRVKGTLRRFLERAKGAARKEGLDTPHARLDAFQNREIESAGGNYFHDYFGYSEKP